MRPPISWSELTSASVGLWGLGVEGAASLRRLQSLGTIPVLVEDSPSSATFNGLEVMPTADGGLRSLLACDVVIKSPGISRYRPEVETLKQSGVAVRGGLGLWLEEAHTERVVCITGTKGKSTTTALAVHLLNRLGHPAVAGGNIGQPPWDPAIDTDPEYWIIETSSFQIPDLTNGPPVVAVTSLFPDHLDWHGSVERYYSDKLSLCSKPGVERALAPEGDALLRAQLRSLGDRVQWVGTSDFADPWVDALGLPGTHNVRNASLARAVLVAVGIVEAGDDTRMAAAAEGFAGLFSRCESIGHVGEVEFVNDSLATNVLPTLAALQAFGDRKVALLVGGHDRGLDYSPLADAVAQRGHPTLVVTMPDNGPRIGQAVRQGSGTEVVDAIDLDEAVATAFSWAQPDGVVLLSPAAPSFGRFEDYRDRARAFRDAAAQCGPLS
jgi:UDP-N-acetylmuramoylalanine--D-glutamate ligase